MQKPVLVIMAAGLGSRYGGLKQMAPVDDQGHINMDFSIYDAVRAGFSKIVFIITEEMDPYFREAVGNRLTPYVQTGYVYQKLDTLPPGFSIPEGRVKPWGTAHAVLCAASAIDGPFAVINADDFYGRSAFDVIYRFLSEDRSEGEHAMVGYRLRNTLTENGHVARGICTVDENGFLMNVTERTHIIKRGADAAFSEDNGNTYTDISGETIVSMNLWGFQKSALVDFKELLSRFLRESLPKDPLKCEYFITLIPNEQVCSGKGTVKVLQTAAHWYGVTYNEDMPAVHEMIARVKAENIYPEQLWGPER